MNIVVLQSVCLLVRLGWKEPNLHWHWEPKIWNSGCFEGVCFHILVIFKIFPKFPNSRWARLVLLPTSRYIPHDKQIQLRFIFERKIFADISDCILLCNKRQRRQYHTFFISKYKTNKRWGLWHLVDKYIFEDVITIKIFIMTSWSGSSRQHFCKLHNVVCDNDWRDGKWPSHLFTNVEQPSLKPTKTKRRKNYRFNSAVIV